MDEPETVEQLVALDEMTLHFAPLGLLTAGILFPEDALKTQRAAISRAVLVDDVAEEVRENWARLRKLYLYGLMEYELFSGAHDQAHLVLEGAFRARFVSYYNGEIPVLSGGQPEILYARSFQQVYEAPGKTRLLDSVSPPNGEPLPRSFARLFAWARARGMLVGQRSQLFDELFPEARNRVAHPDHYQLGIPPEASRLLNDVAEIINKLWGHDTPGGRIFPGPLARRLRVVAIAPDGDRSVEFMGGVERAVAESEYRDWTHAVFRAAPDERLTEFGLRGPGSISFAHLEGFQTTTWPCQLVWGPDSGVAFVEEATKYFGGSWDDKVSYVDRLFLIREQGGEIDYPRSVEDLRGLGEATGLGETHQAEVEAVEEEVAGDERMAGAEEMPADAEIWHYVVADHPWDANQHVRAHVLGLTSGEIKAGRCRECHVTYLERIEGLPTVGQIGQWMDQVRPHRREEGLEAKRPVRAPSVLVFAERESSPIAAKTPQALRSSVAS